MQKLAYGLAFAASLGDKLLNSGRRCSDLGDGDFRFCAGRLSKSQHLIGNIEDWKESGEEWVTESDLIRTFSYFEVGVQLLDEHVTVSVASVHSRSHEVLHRDVIVVITQLDDEVVWHVDILAVEVAPVAELVVLPGVAVELVRVL